MASAQAVPGKACLGVHFDWYKGQRCLGVNLNTLKIVSYGMEVLYL